jgi:2-polyprenyl-3-methyl-5-hydroxy-6-metoxy-1,4-benzoquinol methylase
MEHSLSAGSRPLWQQKLDTFIQNKLVDSASPHHKRWVERSEEYNSTHTQNIMEILRREFGQLCGLSVLDVGCGNGLDAINLARAGAIVTGVEVSQELIEIAQLRAASENLDVNFLSLDRFHGSCLRETYDAVIAIDVLEHVEKPMELFTMCNDMLRAGGILILTTPNRWALGNIISDPHWHLFGVTLLPRALSERYMVRVRRVLREYDMTEFVGLRSIRTMLSKNDFVTVTDSAIDAERKLSLPGKVVSSGKRKAAKIISGITSISLLRRLSIWSYCYAFVRTWQVVAKKPEKRVV